MEAPTPAPHWFPDDPLAAGGERVHDRVLVTGADARSYLQSQLTQDVEALEVGDHRWSFVLEPNGKVTALVRVVRLGAEEFALDTDAGFGDALVERLARFRIRVKVDLENRPAAAVVDEHAEQHRIVVGWPKMGAEILPETTLVAQTGLSGLAVSFTKGCYPGQELVERMDSRGATAPQVLRTVAVDPATTPGQSLCDDSGEVIGVITSVAGSHGLALVRRGVEVGTAVHFEAD